MRHQITPAQLRLGMYIVGFDESWLNVPFWRKRFLVSDRKLLERVMASGIAAITIDDELGIGPDLDPAPLQTPVPTVDIVSPPPDASVLHERRRTRRNNTVSELDRARQTVDRSKAAMIKMFADARLGQAVEIRSLEPLVDEIAASVARDQTAILSVTRLKTKHEYTYLHSVAVCALMMSLARQIGLSPDEVRLAGMAGMLHDVGKMAIPDHVLDKPQALDDGERRLVETHPEQGYDLLNRSDKVEAVVLDVCLHHHERMDGSGYPHGLDGQQLSLFARMGAICDVYDAVTSERAYKTPWPPGLALARMMSWQGHFDQRLLRAFVTSLRIFPIGGLVRLCSNRLAIVLREDPADPTAPIVRIFFQIENSVALPIQDIATGTSSDINIIQGESGSHWFGDDWTTLSARIRDALLGDVVDLSGAGHTATLRGGKRAAA